MFLVEYGPKRNLRIFTATGVDAPFNGYVNDSGRSIAQDQQGNMLVAGGQFRGDVDFGGGSLVSQSSADILLSRASREIPLGGEIWHHAFLTIPSRPRSR
ncbi:MAG: hypothetical protein R3C68_13310 [Myxococcota bacterium]